MRASLILFLVVCFQAGWSQTSNLNAYEYVIVPMKFDFQNKPNEHRLNTIARFLLKEEGFEVYMDKEERPLEYRGNTCEPLFLEVEETSGFLNFSLIVRLKDCYDNVLFESEEGKSKIKEFQEGYQDALKQAFMSLTEANYSYDSSLPKVTSRNSSTTNKVAQSSTGDKTYPDKINYKFGGETYWLVKKGSKDYSILANEGKENYAELQNADKGTFIFDSKTINGAAYFDAEGSIIIEYMDEDLGEIQNMIFRKID